MASTEHSDFYADPSAYDVLHTPGTAEEVDLLQRIARQSGALDRRRGATPSWLEPACGTARCLRILARRGARVAGFDTSEAMIDYARARLSRLGVARQSRLFVADMTSFAPELGEAQVDVAFNVINTIRHLDSDRAMLAHFAEVARVLRPTGIYIVGLSLSRYGQEHPWRDYWEGTRGRLSVSERVSYQPPTGRERGRRARQERVTHEIRIDTPSRVERRFSSYPLRCYDESQWQRLLARSALERAGSLDECGKPLGQPEIYQFELLRPR